MMSRMRMALFGALAAAAMLPAVADAQYRGDPGYHRQVDDRGYGRGFARSREDGRGYQRDRGSGYGYRGRGGRSRCDRGTGGTIIGAIAGGLLGNTVAGRGDRGVGTIVGAGVGALAGRSIDRDC